MSTRRRGTLTKLGTADALLSNGLKIRFYLTKHMFKISFVNTVSKLVKMTVLFYSPFSFLKFSLLWCQKFYRF